MTIVFCATPALAVLSWVEHDRSLRPSPLIECYLLVSIILDGLQTYALYHSAESQAVMYLLAACLAIKSAIFLLESGSKRTHLRPSFQVHGPEALAGFVSRTFLWWLNQVLFKGSRHSLKIDDFYPIDKSLLLERALASKRNAWTLAPSDQKHGLLLSILKTFKAQISLTVPPRLLVTCCKFSQPLLIHLALSLTAEPPSDAKARYRRLIIGASVLVYTGIAIGTVHYKQGMNRCIVMIRGVLVDLIYKRTLSLSYADKNRCCRRYPDEH